MLSLDRRYVVLPVVAVHPLTGAVTPLPPVRIEAWFLYRHDGRPPSPLPPFVPGLHAPATITTLS